MEPQVFAFSKTARLRKPEDYKGVLSARPRIIRAPHLKVWVRRQRGAHARLGLTVAKRDFPRAVDRNYLKRLVRESFRHNRHAIPGFSIVVKVYRWSSDDGANALVKSLDGVWAQLQKQASYSASH